MVSLTKLEAKMHSKQTAARWGLGILVARPTLAMAKEWDLDDDQPPEKLKTALPATSARPTTIVNDKGK
jgi:hypothetical protein